MNNFNLLNNNINFDNIKKIHLLINYLDDSCSIKKYKQHYIIKKNKKKIIFNDNNFYKDNNLKLSLKKIYIYMFLYNTLDDGWIIKKKLDKYYFKKKISRSN